MVKKVMIFILLISLILMFGTNLSAQEKKEVPKKVVKLVENAVEDAKEQKFDKALEKLNQAKELAPDYAPIYVNLAYLSYRAQNTDETLAHISKAYELDPQSETILNEYAKFLLTIAQQKSAKQDNAGTLALYEKFANLSGIKTKMSNQFVQVAYTLAANCISSKKPEQAIQYLNELLTTPGIETFQQQHLFIYFLLGNAYGQMDETDKAVINLKKFLEMNQSNPANLAPAQFVGMANFQIANTFMTQLETQIETMKKEDIGGIKKSAEAQTEMLQYLNAALTADTQNVDAKYALARYNYYTQNFEQSLLLLNELIAANTGNSDYQKTLEIVNEAQAAKKAKK